MSFFNLIVDKIEAVIGIITVLITGVLLAINLRDRKEICKVDFKFGPGWDVVTRKGGFQSHQKVPGFEVLILNKGVLPLYVSNVHICNKHNQEKFRCSFGAIPLSETPNSPVTSFSNRFSFELTRNRIAKSNPAVESVISKLKISEEEKATLYVLVELESQKTVQSKHLTFRIKDLELRKTEEEE